MADNLNTQVMGPALLLAARVKQALEEAGDLAVETPSGTYYVARVELRWGYAGDAEVVGYLTPDEHEGKTFDFWTPKEYQIP